MTIIISIGGDCDVAIMLKKYNLRKFAYPFDTICSYHGVSEIIKNDFKDFLPDLTKIEDLNIIDGCPNIFNHKYGLKFIHDKLQLQEEKDKYERRINRFKELLKNPPNEKIIFFKKGFNYHNIAEYDLKSEIEDVIELNNYLKENYKELNYEIILVLMNYKYYKDFDINSINEKNIKIYKYLITDIRDNELHNKILTGMYFEKAFKEIMNIS
jgi:hypothetical protein